MQILLFIIQMPELCLHAIDMRKNQVRRLLVDGTSHFKSSKEDAIIIIRFSSHDLSHASTQSQTLTG